MKHEITELSFVVCEFFHTNKQTLLPKKGCEIFKIMKSVYKLCQLFMTGVKFVIS